MMMVQFHEYGRKNGIIRRHCHTLEGGERII